MTLTAKQSLRLRELRNKGPLYAKRIDAALISAGLADSIVVRTMRLTKAKPLSHLKSHGV